ncbi:MAG: hypothetical protein P0Y55_18055 [Candidatus Cohnella colombiensis]|uniref:Antigen I/II N-terminal domain-containing protein n=1 Tax=Candidatus Cohnella colombiensis TaxID=3121368 RepID=A0AA95JAJ3_9BACL|nr:MAG: hypothetical protein P0Y55_18055 [Cohnella sp.]
MKKAGVFILIIALLMTGCSSKNGEKSSNTGANDNVEASSSAESSGATGDGEVTIVFPASLGAPEDVEGMTAEIVEAGATNTVKNDDGSVSVAISQENLNKLLEKYHSELTTMIEGVHSAENTSSIKNLDYDKEKFQEYNITVDKAAYESEESVDGLVIFGLTMQSLMYQIYSGVKESDIKVTINLIDQSTGEVFETSVLPEATPEQ